MNPYKVGDVVALRALDPVKYDAASRVIQPPFGEIGDEYTVVAIAGPQHIRVKNDTHEQGSVHIDWVEAAPEDRYDEAIESIMRAMKK